MKRGDLYAFRRGRDPVTKEILWANGLVLEILKAKDDPINDFCKVLTSDGNVGFWRIHGAKRLLEE